jgi:magnesium-transporting ATPase (P-type)
LRACEATDRPFFSSETTPLQAQLDRTGKLLGLIVIAIAIVMIATMVATERVAGFSAIVDVLILGVALAVAAVPEGLPRRVRRDSIPHNLSRAS